MEKWYLLVFLLCPLIHFIMMKGHSNNDSSCSGKKNISDKQKLNDHKEG